MKGCGQAREMCADGFITTRYSEKEIGARYFPGSFGARHNDIAYRMPREGFVTPSVNAPELGERLLGGGFV